VELGRVELNMLLRKRGGVFGRPLPAVASETVVVAAEHLMGTRFPDGLRPLYVEVADGGFGPGLGLHSCQTAARNYRETAFDPRRREDLVTEDDPEWVLASDEERLQLRDYIPFCEYGCGHWWYVNPCGRVFFTGPDFIEHHITLREWMRPEAPSVDIWLRRWLAGEEQPRAFTRS
jgi:hypothetical protein